MILKTISLIFLTGLILFQYHHVSHIVFPIKTSLVSSTELTPIQKKLSYLNVPKDMWWEVEKTVKFVETSQIDENLVLSIIKTESSFNKKAVSSKNYKGLMQIPYPLWTAASNITAGVDILKEKLALTNGNMIEALILYKGCKYERKKGLERANEVLEISKNLKRRFDDV